MEFSGRCAAGALEFEDSDALNDIKVNYHSIFDYIQARLGHEMESWTTGSPRNPSLLFYTSSLFAYCVVATPWVTKNPDWAITDISFRSMCSTIHAYWKCTIDKYIVDTGIQERIHGPYDPRTFSSLWWDRLTIHKLLTSTSPRSSSLPSSPVQTNIGTRI